MYHVGSLAIGFYQARLADTYPALLHRGYVNRSGTIVYLDLAIAPKATFYDTDLAFIMRYVPRYLAASSRVASADQMWVTPD